MEEGLLEKHSEPKGMVGRKNIYVCQSCRGHIVTVDRDEGVTPFMIPCQTAAACPPDARMQSSFYRVFREEIGATHEWYRPTEPEIAALGPATQDHVRRGGLLLRKIEGSYPPLLPPIQKPAP